MNQNEERRKEENRKQIARKEKSSKWNWLKNKESKVNGSLVEKICGKVMARCNDNCYI